MLTRPCILGEDLLTDQESPVIPGQWIARQPGPTASIRALTGMMAGQPSALVWVGVKADGRPVHVLSPRWPTA